MTKGEKRDGPGICRNFAAWAGVVIAGLSSASTLLKGAAEFQKSVAEFVTGLPGGEALKETPWSLWITASLLLVLLGVSLWHWARVRRSRFAEGVELTLDPDNPEHLVGRADTIQSLKDACADQRLTFLTGESGCGKTALLRAGLIPALREGQQLLPLYIHIYGQDWVKGPEAAVCEALWDALELGDRKPAAQGAASKAAAPEPAFRLADKVGLKGRHDPENGLTALGKVREVTGRIPLLIFDQFDDYQLRHHERFLIKQSWRTPAEVIRVNSFWKGVRDLIKGDAAHAVFCTRQDTRGGLSSVEFLESDKRLEFALHPLPPADVKALLNSLTDAAHDGSEVVIDPEHGWTKLRDRLTADLQREGSVLPARLKLVLGGLREISCLTTKAYEAAGGAVGLEAGFVQRRVREAAQHSGLSADQVRSLLMKLIDRASLRGSGRLMKTVPRPATQLMETLQAQAGAFRRAVTDLRDPQKTVLRMQVLPDTREEHLVLDHDHLCAAVDEADRRANRPQRELAEAYSTFRRASEHGGLRRRWQALLGPLPQVRFLWSRLRSKLRYGAHRSFAMWSLLRWAPSLLVLLSSTALLWQGQAWLGRLRAAEAAGRLLARIGNTDGPPKPSEVEAFWDLCRSDEDIRVECVRQGLLEGNAIKLQRRTDWIVQAAVGLRSDVARRVIRDVWISSVTAQSSIARQSAEVLIAWSQLGRSLATMHPHETEHIEKAIVFIVAGIEKTPDPGALGSLAQDLKAVAGQLKPEQCEKAFSSIVAAIEKTTDSGALESLAEGLKSVAGQLKPKQCEKAFSSIVAAIEKTPDPGALRLLADCLKSVPGQLKPEQCEKAFSSIIAAIEKTPDPGALRLLADCLKSVPGQLKPEQCEKAFSSIIAAIEKTPDPGALRLLADCLKSVPGQLKPEQCEKAFSSIIAAIEKTTDSRALRLLADGLKSVAGHLKPEQCEKAFASIVAAIEKTTDSGALRSLAEGLKSVPVQLKPEQCEKAFASIVAAIERATDSDALQALAEGLKSVAGQLKPEQCEEAFASIVAAIEKATDSDALQALAEGLKSVAGQLKPEQCEEAFASVVAAIEKTTDRDALRSLAEGLKSVPGQLKPEQCERAFAFIVAAIEKTADPHALRSLADGLKAVPGQVKPEQCERAFAFIVAAIEKASDPYALGALVTGLKSVLGQFNPEQCEAAFASIVAAIERTTDPDALRTLSGGLKSVPGQIKPEQCEKVFASIVAAIEGTTDPDALRSLAQGLKSVPGQIKPEQSEKVFASIVAAIEGTTDPDALRSLAQGLKSVPGQIKPEQSEKVFAFIVGAMERATDPDALPSLAESLKSVPGQLKPEQWERAFTSIVAALEMPSDLRTVWSLGEVLRSVAEQLRPEQCEKALVSIVASIEKTSGFRTLWSVDGVLKSVAGQLKPEQCEKAFASIVLAIEKTSDPGALRSLAGGLKPVAGQLKPEQREKGFASIIAAIEKTTDPDVLGSLAQCLLSVRCEEPQQILDLLKLPFAIGHGRTALLEVLSTATRENFGSDLWRAVRWAESTKDRNGQLFDLKSPPRHPGQPR